MADYGRWEIICHNVSRYKSANKPHFMADCSKNDFWGQEHGEKHILPRGTYNDGSKNIQNRDFSLLLPVISNYFSIFANS